ncbi:Anti-sigma regulatory factor (Ser/Thr protein kinase) [Noviherbaspirillum humi]|uniref:Anti-sigma regulatory factor (Ser/Thr protein kinase) n=1 Tax=Noviherbaspirillum humi TaxID=1688639 RepID=A0A239I496_9BURK|nr:ATP-binding SpoIIE family protein phosphatase [Noviherbaspirillum humi]SNS88311.1 Anti-sigma regulatory factor (Ser/Thr protein kinase) [Noviherbaspirillum humi]
METILSPSSRQRLVRIEESSAVAAARREATDLAAELGFDDIAAGEVALVVTEAATNILKHAGRGQILIRPLRSGSDGGIEVLAIDAGPGMRNVSFSMQDGTSTAGSYGVGLGAMRRLADEFDLYTQPDKGTVILMTVWPKGALPPAPLLHVGAVCVPIPGEVACGDAWAIAAEPNAAAVMVADGLGHGEHAAAAAGAATSMFADAPGLPPAASMQDVHGALRATRGAAVAIARIDMMAEQIVFAGVGNIAASVLDGRDRRQLVSHNGIVGSNMRKVQEFTAPWHDGCLLLMHSDGLGSRWDIDQYPGLAACHPAIIAGVLYRDFCRGRDDVTVLAVREGGRR